MGVPKFYRWISERYPCLSQIVREHQIPIFDNLYLDMNGIIHICSHPNDDDVHFRISEEKIFTDIFHYIEVLFDIIEPRRVFVMAVDGVAPRAKMNQQRGRRFRSAKEAQDQIKKALSRGETLPEQARFDSNCITPGTEFMVKLNEQLKYFVNKKMSTDRKWRNVNVILSGHDVPGEGEHKIMDYIRWARTQADYNPNTRHCLYGLDADLMMLGLSSHEPHFSLLREEVRFGGAKSKKRIPTPEETTFHLLHLSLMREYIDHEFYPIRSELPFGYDLERVIDDWVLMGFLVGNDFIPHLPDMHINQDALPYLYETYKKVLPSLDGYINEGGVLNLKRFETYLKVLSKFDFEQFDSMWTDLRHLEGKRGRSRKSKQKSKPAEFEQMGLASLFSGNDTKFSSLLPDVPDPDFSDDVEDKDDDDEENEDDEIDVVNEKDDVLIQGLPDAFKDRGGLFASEFAQRKKTYYREKLGFDDVDSGALKEQSKCYVVAIQWILHYYFNGVPSWSWFYPYHYAPFLSDIRNISNFDIHFELGKPFKPFEQLLAVLPAASKELLPYPFQGLMVNQDSSIIDFYPQKFDTDLNGKKQDWEAVVLIPFIEEKRLLKAMEPLECHLSQDEKDRNAAGMCLSYKYSSDVPFTFKATYRGFPDVTNCKAKCTELSRDCFSLPRHRLRRGVCPGVRQDVYFPGFPTLKFLKYEARFEHADVRVFQSPSKNVSMIIDLKKFLHSIPDAAVVAKQLVGKTCYVGWPHLVEAFVHSVQTEDAVYKIGTSGKGVQSHPQTQRGAGEWQRGARHQTLFCSERHGIFIGPVKILLKASCLIGKRRVYNSKLDRVDVEKQWEVEPSLYPYQLCVKNINVFVEKSSESFETLSELFPVGSDCFLVSNPYYGSTAKVKNVDKEKKRIHVKAAVVPEPDFEDIKWLQFSGDEYKPSGQISYELGLHPLVLSRIMSSVKIEKTKTKSKAQVQIFNVGLRFKNARRNQELPGYARKVNEMWTYSYRAVQLLNEYIERFTEFFIALEEFPEVDVYEERNLFPDNPEYLSEMMTWLHSLPTHKSELLPCGSESINEGTVKTIDSIINRHKEQNLKTRYFLLKVKPNAIYSPNQSVDRLPPDSTADYRLFDRVVYVQDGGAVPFGFRGVIIGIQGDVFDVVFDESFLGGKTIHGVENRGHKIGASALINLSFGQRLERGDYDEYEPPAPAPAPAPPPPRHNQHRPAAKKSTPKVGEIQIKKRPANEEEKTKKTEPISSEGIEQILKESLLIDSTTSKDEEWVHAATTTTTTSDDVLDPDMAAAMQGLSDLQMTRNEISEMDQKSLELKRILNVPSSTPPPPPPPSQPLPFPPAALVRPGLHQHQYQNSSPQFLPPPPPPPPRSVLPSPPPPPSALLLNWCQLGSFPAPVFRCVPNGGGFECYVDAAGNRFRGFPSMNQRDAFESAAMTALQHLGVLPPSFSSLPPRPPPPPPPHLLAPATFSSAGLYNPQSRMVPPSGYGYQQAIRLPMPDLQPPPPVATGMNRIQKNFVPLQVIRRNPEIGHPLEKK
ncbi:5'-3' exoribonuclease 1-like isoform X2 [Oscarella lobularis]|uniref:5'-3' exoribonuclease 1-like isoform X2 n=1 Tax=Oscarella lobularis TaxID=121494 RepID=UPI0033131FEF